MRAATKELYRACARGEVGRVRMCISGGADLKARPSDWNGQSPLHVASVFGRTEVARLLLEAGADVSQRTRDEELLAHAATAELEETALHLAALEGHADTVRILVGYGADPNALDARSSSPLCHALEGQSADVVAALLDAGADINLATPSGSTPLHKAATEGYLPTLRVLLAGGATVDAKDKDGWTPLRYAVEQENVLAACELVASGADPMLRDGDGVSTKDKALAEGYVWFDTMALALAP